MSNYENYTRISGNYDNTRIPVGTEIIVGCLSRSETPIAQQQLLDAGCGTSNYSYAMLSHLKQISAVDMNASMLECARQKCSDSRLVEQIDFHQAAIDHLPFDDAVFDGIMIN
jgi:ubiquinone/menaquinone biosynthesis C-methylase UbiE